MVEKILKKFNGENRKKTILTIVAILVGVVVVFMGYQYLFPRETTDDAFIEGHVIMVSPQVSGHILKVYVRDNQLVQPGDLLAQIDERDYAILVELEKAEVAEAQAESKQAQEDLERYNKLFASGDISKQQLDKVVLHADTTSAQLGIAQAKLKQAELNFSYTKIVAITSGHITRKSVEEGNYVQAGQSLLALVPLERWVIANFKETQLTQMHPGQKVAIHVDTFPQQEFYGHVDSIQRGTGSRFSLLPAENATGNFVKVVQRIPVKILLDSSQNNDLLSLGMSVVPVVKLK